MASSLCWKHLSKEQVQEMLDATDPQLIKSLLAKHVNISEANEGTTKVVMDYHFFNLAFAREQRFPADKVSTFMGMMMEVLALDRGDGLRTMAGSFGHFKKLLHMHAVERPPSSVGLFSVDDAKAMVDHVTNSYYRHFHLYKYVLAKKPQLELTQTGLGGVESPPKVRPLTEALQEG